MYDLRHLEHAIAVAEHRSFRRAAEALGISQPGLSRSIREFERRVGARLFDRGRTGVDVTPIGKLIIARGRAALVERDDLAQQVRALQGIEIGSISVDLGPYPAALYGHAALARFLSQHPDIRIRVRVTNWLTAIAAVLAKDTDLAIAELSENADDPSLQTETLSTCPGCFVCRADHEVLTRGQVTFEMLVSWPWAATGFPARMAEVLPADVGRAGRWERSSGRFIPAIDLEMMTGIGRIACESDALVMGTLSLFEEELEKGRLKVVPFAAPWFRMNAGFLTLRGRTLAPAVLAFAEVVRQVESELADHEAKLRARFVGTGTAL